MNGAEAALPFFGKGKKPSLLSAAEDGVKRVLESVRAHLGMDVAFISEFLGDYRTFRHVDSQSDAAPIKVGERISLDNGYCKKIIDGLLPELIPNTANVPEALAIPDTHLVPIGAHLSVPIRLSDGRLYGTFCCFSFQADMSLNNRDLQMMKAFADLVAYQIEQDVESTRRLDEIRERIEAVLVSGEPSMVYQPTFDLKDRRLLGAESLSRFQREPGQTPDLWFNDAAQVGLQSQLEMKAIRNAIECFRPAWQAGLFHLGLNCSPQTLVRNNILDTLTEAPLSRLVIEITEHAHVDNYDELMRALAPLRALGIKVAVDDVGSGYASMRHVLNIRPDMIKLDISLTRGIDSDRTRRALAGALCEFGRQTECTIIAEGIETAEELETLRGLGVDAAQGYFLGMPMPFSDFERKFVRRRPPV